MSDVEPRPLGTKEQAMSDPARITIISVEMDPPEAPMRDVRVQVQVVNPSESTYAQLVSLLGHEITLAS
jgi:hypothetical protein